jgi:hypothetical protein
MDNIERSSLLTSKERTFINRVIQDMVKGRRFTNGVIRDEAVGKDRRFINSIIHDGSMEHDPDVDQELERLRAKCLGDRIEAETTSSAASITREVNAGPPGDIVAEVPTQAAMTDAGVELSPGRLDTRANPVVLPFGEPLIMVASDGMWRRSNLRA